MPAPADMMALLPGNWPATAAGRQGPTPTASLGPSFGTQLCAALTSSSGSIGNNVAVGQFGTQTAAATQIRQDDGSATASDTAMPVSSADNRALTWFSQGKTAGLAMFAPAFAAAPSTEGLNGGGAAEGGLAYLTNPVANDQNDASVVSPIQQGAAAGFRGPAIPVAQTPQANLPQPVDPAAQASLPEPPAGMDAEAIPSPATPRPGSELTAKMTHTPGRSGAQSCTADGDGPAATDNSSAATTAIADVPLLASNPVQPGILPVASFPVPGPTVSAGSGRPASPVAGAGGQITAARTPDGNMLWGGGALDAERVLSEGRSPAVGTDAGQVTTDQTSPVPDTAGQHTAPPSVTAQDVTGQDNARINIASLAGGVTNSAGQAGSGGNVARQASGGTNSAGQTGGDANIATQASGNINSAGQTGDGANIASQSNGSTNSAGHIGYRPDTPSRSRTGVSSAGQAAGSANVASPTSPSADTTSQANDSRDPASAIGSQRTASASQGNTSTAPATPDPVTPGQTVSDNAAAGQAAVIQAAQGAQAAPGAQAITGQATPSQRQSPAQPVPAQASGTRAAASSSRAGMVDQDRNAGEGLSGFTPPLTAAIVQSGPASIAEPDENAVPNVGDAEGSASGAAVPARQLAGAMAPRSQAAFQIPAQPQNPQPAPPHEAAPSADSDDAALSAPLTPSVPDPTSLVQAAPPAPAINMAASLAAASDAAYSGPASPAAQVAPAMVSMFRTADGNQKMTLKLRPDDLGQVEVKIETAATGPARVEITVEKPETLNLMLRDQAQLQRALDLAGLPADGRSVTFHIAPAEGPAAQSASLNASPNSSFGAPQGSGSQNGWGGGEGGGGRYGGGSQTGSGDPESSDRSARAARWQRAGLDITA